MWGGEGDRGGGWGERGSIAKTEGVVEGTEDWGELGGVEILWENLPWEWRLILESLNGILEGED